MDKQNTTCISVRLLNLTSRTRQSLWCASMPYEMTPTVPAMQGSGFHARRTRLEGECPGREGEQRAAEHAPHHLHVLTAGRPAQRARPAKYRLPQAFYDIFVRQDCLHMPQIVLGADFTQLHKSQAAVCVLQLSFLQAACLHIPQASTTREVMSSSSAYAGSI